MGRIPGRAPSLRGRFLSSIGQCELTALLSDQSDGPGCPKPRPILAIPHSVPFCPISAPTSFALGDGKVAGRAGARAKRVSGTPASLDWPISLPVASASRCKRSLLQFSCIPFAHYSPSALVRLDFKLASLSGVFMAGRQANGNERTGRKRRCLRVCRRDQKQPTQAFPASSIPWQIEENHTKTTNKPKGHGQMGGTGLAKSVHPTSWKDEKEDKHPLLPRLTSPRLASPHLTLPRRVASRRWASVPHF
ncbi:unnamed protein product [Protopolystoma xenopodis]|uniref:Uncharacterized protein n=1 Tax=Protopolystoma xenopodis TaxID=117903 RepID=A0A3S5AVM6_9PLAT|nr:unnamed protein product [Protopolystoma xenopodis]